MDVNESRNRIRARVWQALAQSEIDLDGVSKEEQEKLVDLVADAALVEADEAVSERMGATKLDLEGLDDEEILWEGRPFLSITTRYIITNERIRIFTGLLGKDKEDVELIRVQDIDQKQTLRERVLNLGDVIIHSHDSSHPTIELNNVKNPEELHQLLRKAVVAARKKHGLIYREEM